MVCVIISPSLIMMQDCFVLAKKMTLVELARRTKALKREKL